jgi:hypothetical protein
MRAEISSGFRQKASANSPFFKILKLTQMLLENYILKTKYGWKVNSKKYGGLYAWTLIFKTHGYTI